MSAVYSEYRLHCQLHLYPRARVCVCVCVERGISYLRH
jgi:hypothetical protein